MNDAEKLRRARIVLARMMAAVAEAMLDVESDAEHDIRSLRDFAPTVGEYAGMLEDACRGVEPFSARSRTKKVRKAFGYIK